MVHVRALSDQMKGEDSNIVAVASDADDDCNHGGETDVRYSNTDMTLHILCINSVKTLALIYSWICLVCFADIHL